MNKEICLAIGRWAAVLAAVILLHSMLVADPVSSAPIERVEASVTAALDLSAMQKADNQSLRRLYGLEPSDYEACVLYSPLSNMDAEELLIVKLKDNAQAQTIEDAVEKRLQTQKASFEGYGVSQFDLLTNHSICHVSGNYVLFVINKNATQALQAFLNAL